MSIYKNKGSIDSARRLANVGESGLYSAFGVGSSRIVSAIKGLLFLIVGSIALPLRVTVRRKIGERSVDIVKFLIGAFMIAYIGLYGFTATGIFGESKEALQKHEERYIQPIRENFNSDKEFEIEYWDYVKFNEKEQSKPEWLQKLTKNFPNSNFPVLVYLVIFIAMSSVNVISNDNNIKTHSYYRGKTFLHLFMEASEEERLWTLDACLWLGISIFFIDSISESLSFLIGIQAVALIVEERAVARKKRYAVLDIIDAEIESKMINQYRAKFIETPSNEIRNKDTVEEAELA